MKYALFVVAFFPSNNPVPARIQDPVHTVKMYLAPGACFLRNSMRDGSTASGVACLPVRDDANGQDHGYEHRRLDGLRHTTGDKNQVVLLKVVENLSVRPLWN